MTGFRLRLKQVFSSVFCFVLFLFANNLEASPITIQSVDADARDTLLTVSRLGNVPLVLDGDITGKITLNITAEPRDIIKFIASAKGFLLTEENNIFVVSNPKNNNAKRLHVYKAKYNSPAALANAINLSLSTAGINKNVANKANSAVSEGAISNVNSNNAVVTVDALTGSVIFYATDTEAHFIRAALTRLDTAPKQVALEAEVVAISKDASRELGIDWLWSDDGDTSSMIEFGRFYNGKPFEFYYNAKVNALLTDGKAKILARPNIKTVQGREAIINIGSEVPVPTRSETDTRTTITYKYRETGIILRYTPWVDDSGAITANVHTEVSSPLYVKDINAYKFQKRSADTTVRLNNGETMVIGGLIGSDEAKSLSKIPFLGDLPLLGALFRNEKNSRTESEIMIFLTASIIDGNDKNDLPKGVNYAD